MIMSFDSFWKDMYYKKERKQRMKNIINAEKINWKERINEK